jgi:mono/diheme cytochrome c family protein
VSPLINAFSGVIFISIGAVTVFVMIHLKGRSRDHIHGKILVRMHRILGYVFIAVYVLMIVTMIIRISDYQDELSPRAILHVVFALSLLPLLAAKWLVARKYKLLTFRLFLLGMTIFLFAFLLNAISAGHYYLYRGAVSEVAISSIDKETMNEDIGRQLVVKKCAKCHTLERIFRSYKDEDGWTSTVNRMALIDTPNIRDYNAKQIIFFLVKQQENRIDKTADVVENEIGKTLLDKKCAVCHNLDRVYQAQKSEDEWLATVERMKQHARDPDFLNEKETKSIVDLLATKPVK